MVSILWTFLACGGADPAPPPAAAPAAAAPARKPRQEPSEASQSAARNRPPQIKSIALRPDPPKAGEDIQSAIGGSDPDGDNVTIDVVWVVNDSTWYDQTDRTLPGAGLKRGDKVKLSVTVSDGVNTVQQDSKELEVANTPPELLTEASAFATLDGLQVRARDVDLDELSFSFTGAPDGLTIDPRTGRVSYVGSETEKGGAYQVTLVVDDGHRGTASLSFGLNVAAGNTTHKVRKGSAEDPAAAAAASDTTEP